MKALLWIYIPSELFGEHAIFLAYPSFSCSSLESVNLGPGIWSPIIRIPPLRAYPLITSFKPEFSQHLVILDVPGL